MNTFSIVLLYYKVYFYLHLCYHNTVDLRIIVKLMIKIIFQYIKKKLLYIVLMAKILDAVSLKSGLLVC
jgi:hypothetical protein